MRIPVVLQVGEGLVSDLKHDVSMVLEEYFRRGVLPFLLDLLDNIIYVYIDVMKCSLSLQRKSQESVWLGLSELILLDVLCGVTG